MQKQFVTYEIALKLKELGFNEDCFGYWRYENLPCPITMCKFTTKFDFDNDINFPKFKCLAPLWQQAIDWFREKHNICIIINCVNWRNGKQFEGYLCKVQTKEMIDSGDYSKYLHLTDLFVTYEEAHEQAILKAIEICQNKKL